MPTLDNELKLTHCPACKDATRGEPTCTKCGTWKLPTLSSVPEEVRKKIDDILTSKYGTKPDGRAWCTRHLHKLDVGVCISCMATKDIEALINQQIKSVLDELEGEAYDQRVRSDASSLGSHLTVVRLEAIQKIRSRYE